MERNGRKSALLLDPAERWSTERSGEIYDVASWGKGYFSVDREGHVRVHPTKDPARSIDLKKLVDTLVLRGISLPVLIRFADILKHRLGEIHDAFAMSIAEHRYQAGYCCVYPIKVNQQRQVVEEVLEFGKPYKFGLEAGSKPELMAVMALADNETPIICNGFKDDEYIEMAMLAQKLGRKIIPVVEKYTELRLIVHYAKKVGVKPEIGIRVKLASRGSGRWKGSGGYRSKFGLTVTEAMQALEELKELGMSDCLQLLHFHLGSQITNIRQVKGAVNEAVRVYVELARAGGGLRYLDVGGGLGVDYDGSQTDFESSVNYTLQEYANDVVYHIQNVCDEAQIAHPTIVTESGRAIAAYHSVLVFNVLGVSGFRDEKTPPLPPELEQPLIDLQETFRALSTKNLLESYHDAQQALDSGLNLFSLGYLPIEQRCLAENLYWSICRRIQKLASELDYFPEELEGLTRCCRTPISAISRCSSSTAGPSNSFSPSCRFTGWTSSRRGTRGAGRHHLRLGREGRPVHRPARREADAGAASIHRRRLLSGGISGGRVSGNPGRPTQSFRRHQRCARADERDRRGDSGSGDQGRYREGSAELCAILLRRAGDAAAARRGDGAAGGPDGL